MFLQDSVHVCITNMLLSHVDKHTYDFCEDKIPIPSSSISCRMRAHFYERRSRRARIIMAAALRRECAVTRRLHGGVLRVSQEVASCNELQLYTTFGFGEARWEQLLGKQLTPS